MKSYDHRGFKSPTEERPTWYFSQSGVNSFRSCPEQARSLFSGEVKDYAGIQALIGTGAHAYMEHREAKEWQRRVADVITEEFEAQNGVLTPFDHPLHNDMYGTLQLAVKAGQAFSKHLPLPSVFAEAQLTAEFPFGRHPKSVGGSPDFVRDYNTGPFAIKVSGKDVLVGPYDYVITDFKVSAGQKYRTDRGGEGWKLQRYATQPSVYCWLVAQEMGIPVHRVGFEYLVYHPEKHTLNTIIVTRDLPDMEKLGMEMDSIIDTAMAMPDHWPLRVDDWHCSPNWCRNYHRCVGALKPTLKEVRNAP